MRVRHLCGVVLVAALLALPRPAAAQAPLFYYAGFDYENPNPDPTHFGEPGSAYNSVGLVLGMFAPLLPDSIHNEYTYAIYGMSPISTQYVGTYVLVNYSPGTLDVYEDSRSTGTPADYGINPPNATSPSTFMDGTLYLRGILTSFQFVYDTASHNGSYSASFTITGGSQFGVFAPWQLPGWTFAGATGNALNVPGGYEHQVAGQNFIGQPTAVHTTSWGQLKATYR